MTYRIGSMCAGYAGLDLAVESVLGGELAWVADNDSGTSKILAHRFPGVPNLGDITVTDWAAVEPVDILTAGFPCQPVSSAGQRKGISDERWLFDDITEAIGRMVARPGLLLLENVPGLLSANGGNAMERVLQGLASLGYVGRYRLLRASDVGAPHKRERWFCVAWPAADTDRRGRDGLHGRQQPGHMAADAGGRSEGVRPGAAPGAAESAQDANRAASGQWRQPAPGQAPGWGARPDAGGPGGAPAADTSGPGRERQGHAGPTGRSVTARCAPADTPGDGRHQGRPQSAGLVGGPDAAERGDGSAAYSEGDPGWVGDGNDVLPGCRADGQEQTTGRGAPADADGSGRGAEQRPTWRRGSGRLRAPGCEPGDSPVDWGAYEPAIRRWEAVLGRPAPRPTEPGRTGERLSPAFVEFMMGLPEGWVTGVPGLSRNQQLHALGNGVVPAQAAMALRLLLGADLAEAAA